ncbi:MAG: putative signal peptide peptidase SppA [Deltaproteobacteria bacterium ADurb.Bin510]|nr:MAG: putative signal peptide peptidase SppA [Deltaproteobacteria bacterium ADurb.Bin510]
MAAVATERRLKPAKVAELADGRVYTGSQARQLGLIDELGGYDRAIEYLKHRTGIKDPRIVEPDEDAGLAGFIVKQLRNEASGLARSAVRLEYSIP